MRFPLESFTLDLFFKQIIKQYADNKSIAFVGEEPITYKELGDRVFALQKDLVKWGISKGEKVLVLGENSPNWSIAYLTIVTLGAVAVPVMPDFPEADINHIIRHSAAKAGFISESLHTSMDLEPLDNFSVVYSLSDFSILCSSSKKTVEKNKNGVKKIKTQMEESQDIHEDDLVEILYTSGTTGHSKGVMLTHKNIVTNAIAGADTLQCIDENSLVLSLLPLAHSYGCTSTFLGTIYCGASLYFLTRKPSPKVLLDAMQKVRPTIMTGVPLVFEKIYHKRVLPQIQQKRAVRWMIHFKIGRKFLYRAAGKRIKEMFGGRLEVAVIGGASLNTEVELFLNEGGIPFTNGYGLSECSPLVAGSPLHEVRMGSVGRPVQGIEVKIFDADPNTGIGEIYVKGPNVMKGYYKNPQENELVFSEDGWLITGDRGYLDKDNYLFIKGRSKNIIVGSSGENIYPEVVEDKLKDSPFVEEALFYYDGERFVARIYLDYDYIQQVYPENDHPLTPHEINQILEGIRKEVNAKLPAFSQINQIIEQPEPFEKTPTNKIKRILYVPGYLTL